MGSTKYFVRLTKEKDNQKQMMQSRCPLCQKVHDLDGCYSYKKLEVGDRKKFMVKQKLCFGCYKPIRKDHKWKKLPKEKNLLCMQQKSSNRTALTHKPKSKESEGGGSQRSEEKSAGSRRKIACVSTTIQDISIYYVVPVKIKQRF